MPTELRWRSFFIFESPDKLLLLVELGNQKFGKLYGFLERLLFLEY